MGRRRREDADDNHDRWLVSYADFITLLFAFFVVMYAVSSVNEGKYRVLSDSLVAAFRNVTVNTRGVELAVQPGVPTLPRNLGVRTLGRDHKSSAAQRAARQRMREMAQRIAEILGPLVKEGRVRVTETSQGVTVEINASVLFASGDASVNSGAVTTLKEVARVLAEADLPVTVEGHADDAPISTAVYPSNWELSVARASSVIRLFVEGGVSPQKLEASGYGEFRPIAENATAEGRARNRRVAILVEAPTTDEVPSEVPIALPGTGTDARRTAPRG